MKWISVKDKPAGSCRVWVIHKTYYPYHPIQACYDSHADCFTFGPQNLLLPCTIALDVTHYIPIPDIK